MWLAFLKLQQRRGLLNVISVYRYVIYLILNQIVNHHLGKRALGFCYSVLGLRVPIISASVNIYFTLPFPVILDF